MSVSELKREWQNNRRALLNLIEHNGAAQYAICRIADGEHWLLKADEVAAALLALVKQVEDLQIRNAHLAFPHIAAELIENQGMAGSRIFSSTVSMTGSAVRNVPLNVLERDLRERLRQQFEVIMEAVAKFQAEVKQESGEET